MNDYGRDWDDWLWDVLGVAEGVGGGAFLGGLIGLGIALWAGVSALLIAAPLAVVGAIGLPLLKRGADREDDEHGSG